MFIHQATTDKIVNQLQQAAFSENELCVLMVGEKSEVDYSSVSNFAKANNIQLLGGMFPAVIYDTNKYEDGAVIQKLPKYGDIVLVKNLSTEPNNQHELIKTLPTNKHLMALTFVDGLASNIAGYLEWIYGVFGSEVNYLGGGAGSLSLQQQPCIFTQDGFFEDAAIFCLIDAEVSLGVKHGWKQLLGPLVVTKAEKNIIYELNWQNAFEIYKEAVEEDSGLQFEDGNFFSIAKGFPFGMFKEGQEDIVRDPIAVDENGALICVGEVPENSVVYILKGQNESLINSAKEAMRTSLAQTENSPSKNLIIDCISRVLFLEDEFKKELEALDEELKLSVDNQPLIGILSLGEISSYGEGLLELFNKTTVVGLIDN